MQPLVSVGIPLYNEVEYLRASLDSLVAQDYARLELLVLDNASEDDTWEICQEYGARDVRFQLVRSDQNVGSIRSFNNVFERAQGRYFFWAAGHDLWEPTFVSRCVALLEQDASVVLAYARTKRIGPDSEFLSLSEYRIDTRGLSAAARYKMVIWHTEANQIYGMWRSEALRESQLFRDLFAPDQLILVEMALKGCYALIDEPLWSRRYPHGAETREQKTQRQIRCTLASGAAAPMRQSLVSHFRVLRGEHFALLRQASFSRKQRCRLRFETWLVFAVLSNVFPGAALFKRLGGLLVPAVVQRRLLSLLRRR